MFLSLVFSIFGTQLALGSEDILKIKVGYVKRVSCEGRLFISAVGNDNLVHLEALPKELGCAVILKPTGRVGVTNLILETSAGSIDRLIEVVKDK